jgi:hypothetical protein
VKANRTLLISILLNLALLGWVISERVMNSRSMNSSGAVHPTVTSGALAAKSKAAHIFPPQPVITPRSASFDWRQVESPNYKEYIANLRAIGCPEKTIKEIITADVNDLFSSRRAALTKTNLYEYWRAEAVKLTEEQRQQLQELSAEKAEVLKDLGVESSDLADLLNEHFRDEFRTKELELEFLPEPKRQSLKDLRFREAQQQLAAGDDHSKITTIGQQTQSEIKLLLTPDEFHEYELRASITASVLREVLKYMEPTEPEFRTIFKSWNELNAHPQGSAEYREAQQSSEAALQKLLGPSRFENYLEGVKTLGYSK